MASRGKNVSSSRLYSRLVAKCKRTWLSGVTCVAAVGVEVGTGVGAAQVHRQL